MAVHLRWGDVGASEHTLEWYADKTVPLAALTEQTLRVKALLGAARQTRGRTLVVHLFSEISEEQVAGRYRGDAGEIQGRLRAVHLFSEIAEEQVAG